MSNQCWMKKCKQDWEGDIKLKVLHESGRETIQTWKLCSFCIKEVIAEPEMCYTSYYKKGKEIKRSGVTEILFIGTPF